jgi:hypothetical protein
MNVRILATLIAINKDHGRGRGGRGAHSNDIPFVNPLQKGLLVCALLAALVARGYAGNDVLGEIQLEGATKVEKTSGVWVDGPDRAVDVHREFRVESLRKEHVMQPRAVSVPGHRTSAGRVQILDRS